MTTKKSSLKNRAAPAQLRRFEAVLRESEARLALLVQSTPAGLVIHGADGKIRFCNPTAARLLGLSETGARGKGLSDPVWRFLREDGSVMPVKEYPVSQVLARRSSVFNLIVGLQRGRGLDVIWVLANAVPRLDSDGDISEVFVNFVDITKRKLAEDALHHRLAMEQMVAGISSRLVNIPGEELDAAIEEALGGVGRLIGADRGYLFQMSNNLSVADNTHEWCGPAVRPQKKELACVRTRLFPWFLKRLRGGKPLLLPSLAALPPGAVAEKGLLEQGGVKAAIMVPIRHGGRLVALIGFDAVRTECRWLDEDIGLLRTVGETFMNALARRHSELMLLGVASKLERRVSQRTVALKREIVERERLETRLIEISEREQRRMGQDLHDGLCQQLMGTALVCGTLAEDLREESLRRHAKSARRVAELVRQSAVEARRLAHGLNPIKLHSNGLMSALHELAGYTTRLFGVACRFECPSPALVDDNVAATHLFRIAQEAVNNAVRHGKPKLIVIRLVRARGALTLSVRDDGRGLSRRNAARSDGMGLAVMRHRAGMIGGVFNIARAPRRGTVVCCRVPRARQKKGADAHGR